MTTRKEQLRQAAIAVGDDPTTLDVFYQPMTDMTDAYRYGWNNDDELPDPIRCTIEDMPDREFDAGYGGVYGEPMIAFSERFVYICGEYDGSEWVEAVPRNPENVAKRLPSVGGG